MLVDELETPSVGRHLPTPESDERPSHEENDMLDDIDDEPFDDLDADEEPDMNPEPELQDGTIDGDFPRNQFADQRLHDSSPSQAQSASISTLNEKRNEQWQREREEISRLAKAAGSKIVSIESDHEEDDDDNEDDGSADELDMWQEAGNQSSNSLGDSRSTHRTICGLVQRCAEEKKLLQSPKVMHR